MNSITVNAPAKLNLALSVGPRDEASGLHPICSWMTTVDLHDEMILTQLQSDRLSRYAIFWHEEAKSRSDIDWSITRDLAVRAHIALEQHVGQRLPVQMKLEKRIPVGGGLGGGSADAAAMLRGCNALFDLNLSDDELASVGRTIGSDIPFLVRGGNAIVSGFGQTTETFTAESDIHAVLVFPDVACATAAVYAKFDDLADELNAEPAPREDSVRSIVSAALAAGHVDSDALFNDLAAAALAVTPALQRTIESVSELAEQRAHVTGSGSTLFILCDDPMHSTALAAAVEQKLQLPALAVRSVAPSNNREVK